MRARASTEEGLASINKEAEIASNIAGYLEAIMRITGLKSICCGADVRPRNPYANVKAPREWEDTIYVCKSCKKPCEGYFTALVERRLT